MNPLQPLRDEAITSNCEVNAGPRNHIGICGSKRRNHHTNCRNRRASRPKHHRKNISRYRLTLSQMRHRQHTVVRQVRTHVYQHHKSQTNRHRPRHILHRITNILRHRAQVDPAVIGPQHSHHRCPQSPEKDRPRRTALRQLQHRLQIARFHSTTQKWQHNQSRQKQHLADRRQTLNSRSNASAAIVGR